MCLLVFWKISDTWRGMSSRENQRTYNQKLLIKQGIRGAMSSRDIFLVFYDWSCGNTNNQNIYQPHLRALHSSALLLLRCPHDQYFCLDVLWFIVSLSFPFIIVLTHIQFIVLQLFASLTVAFFCYETSDSLSNFFPCLFSPPPIVKLSELFPCLHHTTVLIFLFSSFILSP